MSNLQRFGKVSTYELEDDSAAVYGLEATNGNAALAISTGPSRQLASLDVATAHDQSVYYYRQAADILADISSWAYSDCQILIDELRHRGIVGPGTTCKQVSVANHPMLVVSTAFFIRSGNVGVIAFRGTEPANAINFLTDANCRMVDFLAMGHVHGGFVRNVRAVWSELADDVQKAIDDPSESKRLKALYITGHSLGGAMAIVAAALIFGRPIYVKWRPLVRGIYTYGQPMVGDKEFAKTCSRFDKMVFRHVYGNDLVTRLPSVILGNFEHFGYEFHGGEDGWTPRSKLSQQVVSAAVSIPVGLAAWVFEQIPVLHRVRLPYSVGDHSPVSYLQAFREARN
ncbi:lipase family protein [Pendulispora rubella]|uniref:Lipase family protein n=1 Tax=Pendulispora rubella TaxID=2741070 RepID=A0ABZ2KPJ1_9BACT